MTTEKPRETGAFLQSRLAVVVANPPNSSTFFGCLDPNHLALFSTFESLQRVSQRLSATRTAKGLLLSHPESGSVLKAVVYSLVGILMPSRKILKKVLSSSTVLMLHVLGVQSIHHLLASRRGPFSGHSNLGSPCAWPKD
jgi:hypothetical protein